MVLYQHGQDDLLKRVVVGRVVTTRSDELGLWVEAQITAAKEYANAIRGLVEKGVLGWSSGAVGHLVERVKQASGRAWISSWPVAEWSLTPTPAEPRTIGVRQIKSLAALDASLASLLEGDDLTDARNTVELKPYRISKRGGEFCVIGPSGRSHGCHKTRAGAIRQQRALYANEGKTMEATAMPDLPDSAFAYIKAGGQLDDDGKTVPREYREVPHHDADGDLDEDAIKSFLATADPADASVPHMMLHALDLLGMDEIDADAWHTGVGTAMLGHVFKCIRLASVIVDRQAAMTKVHWNMHDGMRLVAEDLAALKARVGELAQLVTKAEEIDRGIDGAAIVNAYRTAFDFMDLEEVA